jgi:rod shape-determining protein MreD
MRMQSFLFRSTIVFLIALFQISLLNLAFPYFAPSLALMAVVSWTLIRGFEAAWPWAVGLGLLIDALTLGIPGVTALSFLIVSYAASFLSRRFLVEHRGFGAAGIVLIVVAATFAYHALAVVSVQWQAGTLSFGAIREGVAYFLRGFGWAALSNAILFFLLHACLSRIEHALDFYDTRVTVKR